MNVLRMLAVGAAAHNVMKTAPTVFATNKTASLGMLYDETWLNSVNFGADVQGAEVSMAFVYPRDDGSLHFCGLTETACNEAARWNTLAQHQAASLDAGATPVLSIGGALDSAPFLTIAASEGLRQTFIDNVINRMLNDGYKHLDLDIEGDFSTGLGVSANKANIALLADELFAALSIHIPNVTVKFGLAPAWFLTQTPIREIATSADTHKIACEWFYFGYDWNDNAQQPQAPFFRPGDRWTIDGTKLFSNDIQGALSYIVNELLSAGWTAEKIEANLVVGHSGYCSNNMAVKDVANELSRLRSEGKIKIHPDYLEFQIPDGPYANVWCPVPEALIARKQTLTDQGIRIARNGVDITIHISKYGLWSLNGVGSSLQSLYLKAMKGESIDDSGGSACRVSLANDIKNAQAGTNGFKNVVFDVNGASYTLQVSAWNAYLLDVNGQNILGAGIAFEHDDTGQLINTDEHRCQLSEKVYSHFSTDQASGSSSGNAFDPRYFFFLFLCVIPCILKYGEKADADAYPVSMQVSEIVDTHAMVIPYIDVDLEAPANLVVAEVLPSSEHSIDGFDMMPITAQAVRVFNSPRYRDEDA